jgi:hypothetical protein
MEYQHNISTTGTVLVLGKVLCKTTSGTHQVNIIRSLIWPFYRHIVRLAEDPVAWSKGLTEDFDCGTMTGEVYSC